MKITDLRLSQIRCFEDAGVIQFGPRCNIFVGQNNAGKSTILKGILAWQGFSWQNDIRSGNAPSFVHMTVSEVTESTGLPGRSQGQIGSFFLMQNFRGNGPPPPSFPPTIDSSIGRFSNQRPRNAIVPFLAKRKAPQFEQGVSLSIQSAVSGTFSNLYSRVDLLATAGHPRHDDFQAAVKEIVGLPITTKASANGKEAGFYLSDDDFVTLDRMGDGVSEMVALIVELCLERGKIFVLEEPETNLHPAGLKALLSMIRRVSEQNQFIIATHSNIVVRDLGAEPDTKVFRVYRDGSNYKSPSMVEEVSRTPAAHLALLRELGYEFTDVGLYDGWLFLEESSAETIIADVLIPYFAPGLKGRLRTYSSGGVTNVEPSVAEFQRLVTFVHLQPVYEGRLWVRTDGDDGGKAAVQTLREKFPYLTEKSCATFTEAQFEHYYPEHFKPRVAEVLAVQDKREKRKAKAELLQSVLGWTAANREEAFDAWAMSAAEPIALLKFIGEELS